MRFFLFVLGSLLVSVNATELEVSENDSSGLSATRPMEVGGGNDDDDDMEGDVLSHHIVEDLQSQTSELGIAKKLEREVKRIGDQIGNQYDKTQPRVKKEAKKAEKKIRKFRKKF